MSLGSDIPKGHAESHWVQSDTGFDLCLRDLAKRCDAVRSEVSSAQKTLIHLLNLAHPCRCLARSRHPFLRRTCPVSGVKRTWSSGLQSTKLQPRSSASRNLCRVDGSVGPVRCGYRWPTVCSSSFGPCHPSSVLKALSLASISSQAASLAGSSSCPRICRIGPAEVRMKSR
jgi:hypothetical protein